MNESLSGLHEHVGDEIYIPDAPLRELRWITEKHAVAILLQDREEDGCKLAQMAQLPGMLLLLK